MEKTISQRLKWQVLLFLARHLPPCKTLVPLFSKARERPLTIREKVVTKLHLFTCEACRRHVAQIEQMSEMVKPKIEENDEEVEPSVKLSDDARSHIKAALKVAAHHKN